MIAIIAIAVIVVLLVAIYIGMYNGIVRKDNRCENAWQTIDAQLQRRNDLIPNLIESVKGYAAHESETLNAITKERAAISAASSPEAKMAASAKLSGELNRLLIAVEAYPELKASANFQQLQTDLTDTENKISYARMSYNDCVLEYNNAITTFPGSVIAGSKFRRRKGFEIIDETARRVPQVKF
ncbi:MAG: LemA family protein [Coriobacteriales bacterium]|nr:LemA family protein [Coriobacteriales bacterium]